MTVQASGVNMPVVLLKDGATQTKGRDAQKNNIAAAKIIAEIVRTSLGPRGMDKMLVDSLGDVTITNDGATILKEIDVQHPAAKMLVEIAKSTDNEVGDGTTSVVVLSGALLEQAESLLEQEVHPTVIVDGYRKAANKAKEYIKDIAEQVTAMSKNSVRLFYTLFIVRFKTNRYFLIGKNNVYIIAFQKVSQLFDWMWKQKHRAAKHGYFR